MKIPNNQEYNSQLYTPINIGKKESICVNCTEEDCKKGCCKRYAEEERKLRREEK